MKICKAGKRGLAGGRKEEEEEGYVEEREDRILPSSWTACFHSCSIARPPDKKKKADHISHPNTSCVLLAILLPATASDVLPKGPLSPPAFGKIEHPVSDK